MKKRTKSIIGLSLATLACGAVAAVLPVASASAGTSETGVFKIADGASIRYQSVEGRPEGLRFIALMSEDVKKSLVDKNKNFGFIVSREDQFDELEAKTAEGATPDYLSMANKSTTEIAITAENIDEKIYEGEDEYAGYWCANIVINMNTQEDSSETEEDFMERAYSAVAYYENKDGSNRVYTTNRQERSIQEVSSKLYLSNDEDWENVKGVYTVGTESTPLLLAQNGKNAYSKLVSMVKAETVDSTLKFALAEDVVAEELLPDTFTITNIVATDKTDKTAYDVESFYTVNHAVTDVYSTNKAISLTDKVSAVFGDVAYTVYDSKGVAVPVTENKFTANTAGAYTVTAARKDCPGKTFSVEVADNEYADGLILDGTSAEDLQVSATSMNPETKEWLKSDTVEMITSFDKSMKYDSESNGSYKIQYKMQEGVATATNGALMKLAIAPTFSKAYYQGLQEAGYEKIAVRFYMEINKVNAGDGMYYVESSQSKSAMQVFVDNANSINKDSFIIWSSEFSNNAVNTWSEMVFDLDRFINYYSSVENLLIWSVAANNAVDMTLYIDNVYAVKQAEMQEEVDYAEKGAVTVNDSGITTISLNGEQIAPAISDNTFTATQSGTYKVKNTARNTYGCRIKTVHVFADDYTMGDIVAYDFSNFSAHNNKSNSSDFSCTQESDGIKVTANQAAQSATAPNVTTYKVNTLYDLSYYQWLKNQGYQYITYECRLDYDISYSTGSTLMCRWAYSSVAPTNYTNDSTTHGKSTFDQWFRESTSSTVTQNDSANKKSSYRPWKADTQVKGKTFIISFSIDDYINTYSSTMNIASFYFNNAAKFDYSVTFGRIQATKGACKF